jgi:replicative superfamily II helicase
MPLGDPAASLFSLLRGAVAPALIAGWRRRGVDRPLPMQRRLLRETEFLSGQNLLLIAPTSAGKTLIGEIALARAMTLGRKGVYLVPTKALAEERLADFTAWLAPAGRRVLCATRDRPESDAPARRGEFDVLIAVYEKFNHLTVARPQSLAAVGAVVVDEIQSIDDAERGATLDLLLTRLRLSPYRPQLVALGAREAGARRLAAWLECELFVDRRRPRELRSGVLDAVGGEFRYVESTNEAESRERLAPPGAIDDLAARLIDRRPERAAPPDPWARSMLAAAAHRVSLGERALVFAPTRAAARHWAQALAALDPAAPAAGALAAIARAEPGQARDRLAEALERGVAFHNADLEPAARAAIERAFNEGEVRAIVSTPTLASGVNLAADAVFHFPWRVIGEGSAGPPVAVSLGAERFAQQGGRAARLGLGEGPGRSILVAAGPAEAERLWSEFIADPPAEPLAAPLAGRPLVSVAVDLLAGVGRGSGE